MRSNLIKSVLIISLACLTSCSYKLDPRWKDSQKAAITNEETKQKTCAALRNRSMEMASLKALFSIEAAKADKSLANFRLSAIFAAPENLRIELLPPNLAISFLIAYSKADQSVLIDLQKKQFETFANSAEMIEKILFVNFPAEQLIYLLSGRIHPQELNRLCQTPASTEIEFIQLSASSGVSILDNKHAALYSINPQSGLIQSFLLRRGKNGAPVLVLDYTEDDFSEPGQEFPRQHSGTLGDSLAEIKINTSFAKINAAVSPKLLTVNIPVGFSEKK